MRGTCWPASSAARGGVARAGRSQHGAVACGCQARPHSGIRQSSIPQRINAYAPPPCLMLSDIVTTARYTAIRCRQGGVLAGICGRQQHSSATTGVYATPTCRMHTNTSGTVQPCAGQHHAHGYAVERVVVGARVQLHIASDGRCGTMALLLSPSWCVPIRVLRKAGHRKLHPSVRPQHSADAYGRNQSHAERHITTK